MDERASAVETGYISGEVSLPSNSKSISESSITVENIMQQPILYDRYAWKTVDTRGANVWKQSVPGVFNKLSTIHKLPLQIYQFFKFTLQVKVVLNATKFHAGKLILWFDPVNSVDPEPFNFSRTRVMYHTGTLIEATGYPNVVIDAEESNVGILKIPWEHVISTFSLSNNSINPIAPLGTIYLTVLNPLTVPDTNVTDADLTFYISCIESKLNVPTRPHNNNFIQSASGTIDSVGSMLSKGKSAASDIASGNLSGGGQSIVDLLKNFNLDKPEQKESGNSNCLSTATPQAFMMGPDNSVYLGPNPEGAYYEQDFSHAKPDELQIRTITSKPMLLGTVKWSSDDLADTLLLELPVTPTILLADSARVPLGNLGTVVAPSDATLIQQYYRYYPNYLSYISQMFEYWQGSIDFRFDFASTGFHSGRLQISFEPVGQPNPIDTAMSPTSAFSSCPNQVFDLRETSSTKFKCDYVSMTPRKRVINPVTTPLPDDEQILGFLRVYVLTKLQKPEQLSDIEFNIYISGGEDFTLFCPRANLDAPLYADLSYLPYNPIPTIQSASGVVEGKLGDDVVTRTSDTKDYPSAVKSGHPIDNHDVFGDNVTNVLDLARRYCVHAEAALDILSSPSVQTVPDAGPNPLILNLNMDYATISLMNSPTDPLVFREGYSTVRPSTSIGRISPSVGSFMRRLAPMYVFWSGSLRYQIYPYLDRTKSVLTDATYAFSNSVLPSGARNIPPDDWISEPVATGNYYNYLNSSYPRVTLNTSQDCTVRTTTPYNSEMHQCLTNLPLGSDLSIPQYGKDLDPWFTGIVQFRFSSPDFGNSVIVDGATSKRYLPVRINTAIGDDFKFRYLIAPPVSMCRDPTIPPTL